MTCGLLLLMATTLLRGPLGNRRLEGAEPGTPLFGAGADELLGILMKAKSRRGSHISVTVCGRYDPTTPATLRPINCEDRRSMLLKEPLCRRSAGAVEALEPLLLDDPAISAASLRGEPVALPGDSFPLS